MQVVRLSAAPVAHFVAALDSAGQEGCRERVRAYFVRAYDLIEDLRKARAEHNLDRRMRVYLAPKVLVVDELGIWPYDRESATAFFTWSPPGKSGAA